MLQIEKLNDDLEVLAYIGHVDNVINGVIPEELNNRRFLVSDYQDESLSVINDKLSSVLYHNPFAQQQTLLSHTHALLLNRAIIEVDEVHPRHAMEVFHLMDESVIRYANLQIFRIGDLEEIL